MPNLKRPTLNRPRLAGAALILATALALTPFTGATLAAHAEPPAAATEEATADKPRTRIVELSGKSTSSMKMIYAIDQRSSPTDRHMLVRDTGRRHYLFTLEEPCIGLRKYKAMDIQPPIDERARASVLYKLFIDGLPCRITKIQQVASKEAGLELAARELAAALATEAAQ
jgi:hypothetical protein